MNLSSAHPHHRRRHHQNIILFVVGLLAAVIFSKTPLFSQFINLIAPFPCLSAFIAGMLFASTFSIATGGLILITLAQSINPLIIIPFGGLGAVFCDFLIFSLFKDKISASVSPIYNEIISKNHFHKILHTRYFSWTLPVIGALIIASPLPDELGVSLLGLSQMKTGEFFLISLISHLFGMSSLVAGSRLF